MLRFSGAAKHEAVRGLAGVTPTLGVSSAEKLLDDTRLRYSASSAVTNGLEECMEEAEHEQGTEVSAALEGAVLTILREIGEDPGREVGLTSMLRPPLLLSMATTCSCRASI